MRPKPAGDEPIEHPFSVIDSGYDEEPAQLPTQHRGSDGPPAGDEQERRVDGRWALAALVLAALAVIAAGGWQHARARPTVRTTVISVPGLASAGLSGCPVDRPCAYSSLTHDSSLLPLVQHYLPQASELSSSDVFDSSSAEFYRSELVAALPAGITITVEVDFDPTSAVTVPAWQSALPSTGPADVELVVAGSMAGSSMSVSAHVPSGVAVPVQALRRLVADPDLQRPQL